MVEFVLTRPQEEATKVPHENETKLKAYSILETIVRDSKRVNQKLEPELFY